MKNLHKSSAWQSAQSAEILAVLEAHPAFRAAQTVLLYYSLPDEVDTHAFIGRWSGVKRILLPVVADDGLLLRQCSNTTELALGRYGIAEPIGTDFTDYASIDLAVVPGVAFDLQGNRLGRGKGYYDRLLPGLTRAYKIGICFPYQLVNTVPADAHDIRMDEIITLQ